MPTSSSQTIVVFAYGSNMLTSRIRERCPSARVLGVAALRGYELKWHKRSKDGSGKCDVVKRGDVECVVFGVLYDIPANEKQGLDKAEGKGFGYEEKIESVTLQGILRCASLYYATDIQSGLRPYTWYKDFVVAGAREHSLPGEYVGMLASVDADEDPNRERHHKNAKLLSDHNSGACQ